MSSRQSSRILPLALLLTICLTSVSLAERPAATKLFPKETLAYVNVPDAKEFSKRLKQTSMGQMLEDPQLKPLADDLYGTLGAAFGRVQEQVGASLDDLWSIPQGEMALAVITVPAAEEGNPPVLGLMAFLEAKESLPILMKMIDKGAAALEKNGANKTIETVDDTKVTVYEMPGDGARPNRPRIVYFEKDGALALCSSLQVAKVMLDRWKGGEGESLAQNESFAAIMKRCKGEKGEEPQLTWFVDPIAATKAATVGNAGAQIGLALLPTIGLDGLKGLGGSVALATETFDSVVHFHLLLDNPRDGVIEALAVGSGDITPERWVTSEAASYATIYWDVNKSFRTIAKLVDSFQGEGAVARGLRRPLERVGLDLEQDILPALDGGRFSYVSWIEQPATATSQGNLIGLKVKDPEKFQAVLDKIVARFEGNLTMESFGGKTYWEITGGRNNADGADGIGPRNVRPCFGMVGDYLLLTDRVSLFRKAVTTEGGDTSGALSSSLEFKLIASKIGRQPGGARPGMITFNRPEEGMKFLYDLANSDGARQGLKNQAEGNEFFRSLQNSLEKNPLPPFKVLQQYLAPAGGVLTDDETGFHYTTFNLKRKRD